MFTPIKSTKVYEHVVDQIKYMIDKGILKKGDKLPPERELVDQLQVSRTSLREALRSLQVMGLIESCQGEGNFIKDNFENTLVEPLSIMFLLQNASLQDIMELRSILEVEMVMIASERAEQEELYYLGELINKSRYTKAETLSLQFDREFHYKIAECAKNFLILNVLQAVYGLMDNFLRDERTRIVLVEGNRQEIVKQHEAVFYALVDRDGKRAAAAMKEHLEFTVTNLMKLK